MNCIYVGSQIAAVFCFILLPCFLVSNYISKERHFKEVSSDNSRTEKPSSSQYVLVSRRLFLFKLTRYLNVPFSDLIVHSSCSQVKIKYHLVNSNSWNLSISHINQAWKRVTRKKKVSEAFYLHIITAVC